MKRKSYIPFYNKYPVEISKFLNFYNTKSVRLLQLISSKVMLEMTSSE